MCRCSVGGRGLWVLILISFSGCCCVSGSGYRFSAPGAENYWVVNKKEETETELREDFKGFFCQRNCKCLDFNQCNDLHLNWTSKKHYSFNGKRKFKSLELELLFLTIKKCRSTLTQRLLQYFTEPFGKFCGDLRLFLPNMRNNRWLLSN